jgi:hypothetical protein
MSKRVIAFALAAVAIIAVWWWRSSDSSKPDGSDPAGESKSDRDRSGGDTAKPTPALDRLRRRLSGTSEEFEPIDADGNALLIPVTGKVLDVGAGGVVPDADIIFKARGRAGEATAASGADGSYSVELAPGLYSITAIAAKHYGMPGTLRLSNKLPRVTHDIRMAGFATIRGQVVDADGAGISDADVSFRSHFFGDKIGTKHVADYSSGTSTTTTSSDGGFELEVVPGSVLIEAKLGDASARTRIEGVAPGQTYDATIVLDASATLSGIVVTGDGAPVADATVRVVIRDSIKELSRRTISSDADGEFRIDGITPGRLDVDAHVDGQGTSQAVREVVTSGQSVEVELVLGDAATIAGTVVDSNGSPVRSATVDCTKHGSKLPAVRVETEGDGTFVCGVSEGLHRIRAKHGDHGNATVGNVRAPATDVEVQLASAGGVRGTVTNSNGDPVESFAIRVIQARLASDGATRVFSKPGTPFSDKGGAFDMPLAGAGTYHLIATAAGTSQSAPVVVEVPSGGYGEASLVIEQGGTITGVVRTTGEQPIAGASIRVPSGYSGPPVFTDSKGAFEVQGVAAGARSVRVVRRGFVAKTVSNIVVAGGEQAEVAIELMPANEAQASLVEYTGIGAVVVHDDGIRIVRLVKKGPALKADVLVEDVIVAVDGVDIRGLTQSAAVELLRGAPGTEVALEIRRGDEELTITVERRAVRSKEYPGHVLV